MGIVTLVSLSQVVTWHSGNGIDHVSFIIVDFNL